LVLAIVRERLLQHHGGWLLDGFPRNLEQAEALDQLLAELEQGIEAAVLLELDEGLLVQRMLGRGRADDDEAVIRNRLEVYHSLTAPLVAHYATRGLLCRVDAAGEIEAITQRIEAALLD
jgi:adenylate kinase